jgi:hypothetical protein
MINTAKASRRALPAAAAILALMASVAACTSSHPARSTGTATGAAPKSAEAAAPTGSSGAAPSGAAAPATGDPTAISTHGAPKKDIIAGLIGFNGKLALSGAQSTNMSFTAFPGVTAPKSSCAHIATAGTPAGKGAGPQFQIPSPPEGGNVVIAAKISPYHGPGTYQKASLITVGPSVVIGNASYNLLAAGASVSLTFHANGSGELTFTGATTAAKSSQSTLSGTIQWTCFVQ